MCINIALQLRAHRLGLVRRGAPEAWRIEKNLWQGHFQKHKMDVPPGSLYAHAGRFFAAWELRTQTVALYELARACQKCWACPAPLDVVDIELSLSGRVTLCEERRRHVYVGGKRVGEEAVIETPLVFPQVQTLYENRRVRFLSKKMGALDVPLIWRIDKTSRATTCLGIDTSIKRCVTGKTVVMVEEEAVSLYHLFEQKEKRLFRWKGEPTFISYSEGVFVLINGSMVICDYL